MAHMHRPGRVGRDIFDIDPLARAELRAAIIRARRQYAGQFVAPALLEQPDIDEARAGDLRAGDFGQVQKFRHDQIGERARVGAGGLGKHHRGVGREIAMRRIAWRFDRDIASIEPGRDCARRLEFVENGTDPGGEAGVKRRQWIVRGCVGPPP